MNRRSLRKARRAIADASQAIDEIEEIESVRSKKGVDGISTDYSEHQKAIQEGLVSAIHELNDLLPQTDRVTLEGGAVVKLPGAPAEAAKSENLPRKPS